MKIKYLILLLYLVFFSCKENNHKQNAKEENSILGQNDTIDNELTEDNIDAFVFYDDEFEYNQLGLACKNNDLKKVEELILKGADINIAKADDLYKFDALYVAIENEHIQIIKLLIEKGANVNAIYTEKGLTPMALATKLNQIEIIEFLIKNGADVNPIDLERFDYQYVPLLIAIGNNNLPITELLIKNGAKTDITDAQGQTISLLKSKNGDWEIIYKYENCITHKENPYETLTKCEYETLDYKGLYKILKSDKFNGVDLLEELPKKDTLYSTDNVLEISYKITNDTIKIEEFFEGGVTDFKIYKGNNKGIIEEVLSAD